MPGLSLGLWGQGAASPRSVTCWFSRWCGYEQGASDRPSPRHLGVAQVSRLTQPLGGASEVSGGPQGALGGVDGGLGCSHSSAPPDRGLGRLAPSADHRALVGCRTGPLAPIFQNMMSRGSSGHRDFRTS